MYQIQTDNNTGIMYRSWETASREAVFLLVHGLGAHSGRWEFLAEYFYEKNISSYALELQGFGETQGIKGHVDSFVQYYSDVIILRDIIKDENPGKKIFLVGESMGALIAFNSVVRSPELFDGLICISPAFSGKLKTPLSTTLAVLSAFIFSPKKQFELPFNAEMCTRDVEYQKVMNDDPKEHRLGTPKLLINILIEQKKARAKASNINIDTLFLIAGDDEFVDIALSEKAFNRLKSQAKKIIKYTGMKHSLSIEFNREEVFSDIYDWVKSRIKGLEG